MNDPIRMFLYEGKVHSCSPKAKFLVETANSTSSYTLARGFGCEPNVALQFYEELQVGANQRKRLTVIDGGTRTVLARTK